MVTAKDIMRSINHADVDDKSITCDRVTERVQKVCAVKYFFEILDVSGSVPTEAIFKVTIPTYTI